MYGAYVGAYVGTYGGNLNLNNYYVLIDFSMELNLDPANNERYPILVGFLKDEPQLRALRYLPQVLEFQNLLIGKFNRKLAQSAASSLTVKDVLEQAPNKAKWKNAFHGFSRAWSLSWQFVDRFGCMAIPSMYKNIVMSETLPISFCLPAEKDEGICALALTQFLVQKHNSLIEKVDEVMLMKGEELQRNSDEQNVVTSKFFVSAHTLTYSLEQHFIPFVEKQCVHFASNGSVVYDFGNAERYLIDMVFSSKPLIDLVIRMIQYSDAQAGGSHLALKRKLRMEPLTKAMQRTINQEIGAPSQAHKCLELLDTCINLLQATGGNLIQRLDVGDQLLGDYASTVLLIDVVDFGSATISREVRLKVRCYSFFNTLSCFSCFLISYNECLKMNAAS